MSSLRACAQGRSTVAWSTILGSNELQVLVGLYARGTDCSDCLCGSAPEINNFTNLFYGRFSFVRYDTCPYFEAALKYAPLTSCIEPLRHVIFYNARPANMSMGSVYSGEQDMATYNFWKQLLARRCHLMREDGDRLLGLTHS